MQWFPIITSCYSFVMDFTDLTVYHCLSVKLHLFAYVVQFNIIHIYILAQYQYIWIDCPCRVSRLSTILAPQQHRDQFKLIYRSIFRPKSIMAMFPVTGLVLATVIYGSFATKPVHPNSQHVSKAGQHRIVGFLG